MSKQRQKETVKDSSLDTDVVTFNPDTKPQTKTEMIRPTDQALEDRRSKLSEFMAQNKKSYRGKGKKLIELMRMNGYSDYDYNRYVVDVKSILRNDSFLRDLTETHYSNIVREIFDDIDLVAEESRTMIESAKTDEKRRSAGRLLLECADMKSKLLTSDIVDVSIQLLSNKLDNLESENNKLRLRNEELKHKVNEQSQP